MSSQERYAAVRRRTVLKTWDKLRNQSEVPGSIDGAALPLPLLSWSYRSAARWVPNSPPWSNPLLLPMN